MNCQILFFQEKKNKKNIIYVSYAELESGKIKF